MSASRMLILMLPSLGMLLVARHLAVATYRYIRPYMGILHLITVHDARAHYGNTVSIEIMADIKFFDGNKYKRAV